MTRPRDGIDPELVARSEAYLDGIFGPGEGRKHTAFIDQLASPPLREQLHRYHLMESDTSYLSIEENYLIGMVVLCGMRCFGPAAMFAKTLLHRGVSREKVLEAVSRLTMWAGGVIASEAAGHIQRAIREYEQRGQASLEAWFPPAPRRDG